jgi:hypothetical protein
MLTVTTAKDGELQFDSMLFGFLTKQKLTDALKAALDKRVAELTEQHPDDVSVQVAAAHHAFQTGADERSRAAVNRIVELVKATPLGELPEGKRPSVQQRREAEPQVALWLTARECLRRVEYQEAGLVIAKQSLAAARRQLDRRYAQAMLQEWGTIASSIGDGGSAIALWEEMLALSTERLGTKSADGRVAPLVQSQYDAALSVAKLSARKVPEFSLKAIRTALEGGPPVPDVTPGSLTQPRAITSATTNGLDEAARQMAQIANDLKELADAWKAAEAPPELIYETLAAIVFCRSRPGEILFYPQSVTQSGASAPNSVGQLLIEAAMSAKRTDDLKKQIADRQASSGAKFIGEVMLAKLYTRTTGYSKAREYLVALSKQITEQPVPSNVDLACHAAIPALDKSDEMVVAAMPIVNVAMNSLGLNLGTGTDALQMKVARVYLREGDSAAAKSELDRYLESRLQRYVNSSADYTQDVRKRDLATVSAVAARYHQMDLALEYLGQSVDATTTTRGEPDISIPVWHLARHVATLPPEQAYQLLFDWTIPGCGDSSEAVRSVAAFNPGVRVPEVIVRERLRRHGNVNVAIPDWLQNDFGAISNLTLLVDAAVQVGKLEELTEKARVIRQTGQSNVHYLLTFCHMAAGERSSWIEKFADLVEGDIKIWRSKKQSGVGTEQATLLRAFTFMQACLRSPEHEHLGRQVADALLDVGKWGGGGDAFITHVQYELAMVGRRKVPVAERTPAAQLGLKLWHPGTPAHYAGAKTPPAIWAAHEGHVVHATGPEHDFLYFRYPLTGEFEFSFDTYSDHFSTGDVGYGGLVCEGLPWANRSAIWPVARHEELQLPRAVEIFAHNRRFTVNVSEKSIRYAINGHLVYEEKKPSAASPWLHLTALHHRRTVFRNAKLTGRPVIPREVPLLHGNRLDGWDASWFKQSLPQRLTTSNATPEADWWCQDGTLHSRRSATGVECQLAYHRPLLSGDVVRYEFFYEPGKIQVHPCIGDLAFILRPDDVRLHWMSQSGGLFPYESWNRNVPAEPARRRGPQQPPLKAGQWNEVVLSLADETVKVQLNGELVYERPIELANNRRFGLFHWRDKTVAQVRNIVLTGDWPTELTADEIANPFMPASNDDSPAAVSARYAIVGEEFLTQTPYDVWLAARELPTKQRYDALREWVLPGRSHPTFRLQAAFAPIDVAPPVAKHASRSGQLVAPAMELIRVASELGKLDEVAELTEQATLKDNFRQRSQAALLALIAMARDDDALASAHMLQLSELRKQMPTDTPEYQQWPEAVALAAALHKPGLKHQSLELAECLVEQQRKHPVNTRWEKAVRHLQAVARWQHDEATKTTPWESKQRLAVRARRGRTLSGQRSGPALLQFAVDRQLRGRIRSNDARLA